MFSLIKYNYLLTLNSDSSGKPGSSVAEEDLEGIAGLHVPMKDETYVFKKIKFINTDPLF